MNKNIYKIINFGNMPKEYVAYPWPDYQEYMDKEWFREESYYDPDKDTYLIPKERIEPCTVIK